MSRTTEVPTAEPTVKPTDLTTLQPTVQPTEHPTLQPTYTPTNAPTAITIEIDPLDSKPVDIRVGGSKRGKYPPRTMQSEEE